ncbi:MAG: FGGY-family carbohydrate kinase [Candidatus Nanopelagicales bacterium]|jgi:xylulokinase|nr:FGGY-family carbohydrate kinase [Candidatus Nanopelagicales bacterium]
MNWILAVDLGNGGPKVAAVDLSGEILATSFKPVSVYVGREGAATQDAIEWEVALRAAVAEVTAQVEADGLHAIGITGQWGSTVPVGPDDEPAGPVILWSDTRSRSNVARILGGPINVGGYAPRKVLPWLRITGGAPSPAGADPTGHALLLQNELSDIGGRCRVLLEPVDYLGFLLTGRAVATPASMTASWLTDNHIGAPLGYVDALVTRSGRRRELLPELIPTGSVQGPLLPDVAQRLGLKPGVPVACGIPDIHAAIIGSGATKAYETHLAVSTTAWFSAPAPFKRTDILHSIATLPGLTPDMNIVGNNIETGGAALSWLREQIIAPADGLLGGGSGIGADGAAPVGEQPTYEALTRLAESAPAGCEGLIFTPWLAGERSPIEDKHLRAAFLNLSFRSDRAMMVRAVMEGVALNINWLFTYYEKFLKRTVPSIRILGGGAQSDLWCSIIASTLDRRIEQVADPLNAQLRGVAMWARVCLGELTLEQAAAKVPVAQTFTPVPGEREVYAANFAEYRKLYGSVKGFYKRMNG